MALQLVTTSGTLKIPAAYAEAKVQASSGVLGTNGIIFLVGEASDGPAFSEESDLSENFFGPDQKADVIAKYKSGALVDAFCGGASASNDVGIQGSPSGFYMIKTNVGGKASATLPAIGGGTYANLQAAIAGKDGNLITRTVTATSEVVPSTGATVVCSPPENTNVTFRVSGGASATANLTTGMTPTQVKTTIDGVTGVTASGGVARTVIDTTRSVTVGNVSGYGCTFTSGTAWAVTPTAGDIMLIPTGSDFTTANEGSYVVTAATSTVIYATKLMDAATATLTAPTAEGPITAGPAELECYSPITISHDAGTVVNGKGKTLEIANTSTGNFNNLAYVWDGTTATKVTWVSTTSAPTCLTSSQEYQVHLNLVRQKDQINETVTVGSGAVLALGYKGTTASATIASGVMTITLTGGGSSSLSPLAVTLSDYPTIGDLCQYLGSLTDFYAAPALGVYSSLASTTLDAGTYTFGTDTGAKTGRIKTDGADFLSVVNSSNPLVVVTPPGSATALIGLPDVVSLGFLSGGSKGSTTNALVQAGLDAMKGLEGNFVVPLFSRNASLDVAAGLTDTNSTYDIASINAAVRSHCLEMSKLKQKKWRRGLCSYKGTFADAKDVAGNLANDRISCLFQDVIDTDSLGTLKTFQPWMGAVKAAAMQAAGFYKDITHKYINISGASCTGYDPNLVSAVESALDAGLLPITKDNGGFKWVSDQTTYGADDNFVYNSLQAGYGVDLIMGTTVRRMERAFIGQSLADVDAATGKTVFGAIMEDLKRLKLIAGDDEAPAGYKNLIIKIRNGNAMLVNVEIKEATSLKFVLVQFLVQAITQTATG